MATALGGLSEVPSWREYQNQAAAFFRSLGFGAETDVKSEGVRAAHMLDAAVRFTRFGIHHFWAVECKDWKSRVTKEKVMAFSAIVQDKTFGRNRKE
jgi:hypothetical protein